METVALTKDFDGGKLVIGRVLKPLRQLGRKGERLANTPILRLPPRRGGRTSGVQRLGDLGTLSL